MSHRSVRAFVASVAGQAVIPNPAGGTRGFAVWAYVPTDQPIGDNFFCVLGETHTSERLTLGAGAFVKRDYTIDCQLTVVHVDESQATSLLDDNLQGFEYIVRKMGNTPPQNGWPLLDTVATPNEVSTVISLGGWLNSSEGTGCGIDVSMNDLINDEEGLIEGQKMAIALCTLKISELIQLGQ